MNASLYQHYIVAGIVLLGALILALEAARVLSQKRDVSDTELKIKDLQNRLESLNY